MTQKKHKKHPPSKKSSNVNGTVVRALPKGLRNLGNTCYFNSVLQCVSRVSYLRVLLNELMQGGSKAILKRSTEEGDTVSLNVDLLRLDNSLTSSYIDFVDELLGTINSRPSISPDALRSALCKFHPAFSNYGQHDSHEALRQLLDGLRKEELTIWKRSILQKYKIDKDSTDEAKNEVRNWAKSIDFCTVVDRIFGGVLVVSTTCSQCNHISLHFELFLDLSLPIAIDSSECKSYNSKHAIEPQAKSKRECKKERKAKGKKGKGRRSKRGDFIDSDVEDFYRVGVVDSTSDAEADEEEDIKDENEAPKNRRRNKAKKKSKKTKRNNNRQFKEEVPDDEEEEDTKTPYSSPSPLLAEDENEEDASTEEMVVVENGVEDLDSTLKHEEDEEEEDEVDELYIGGLKIFNDKVEEKEEEEENRGNSPESSLDGMAADVEDNDGSVSDVSFLIPRVQDSNSDSPPRTAAEAGDGTAVAKPGEEAEAKALATQPIAFPGSFEALSGLEKCLAAYMAKTELTGSNQLVCDHCSAKASDGASGGSKVVRCDAVKRDLIIKPPAVLTLHLKRYQQSSYRLQKCSKSVSFPVDLDLRPFCSRLARLSDGEGQYRLFGVVEHMGHLRSGHYVCYVAKEAGVPSDKFVASLQSPNPWPMRLHHLVYQLRRGDSSVIYGSGYTRHEDGGSSTDTREWFFFSDTHVSRVPLTTVLSAQPYLLFYHRVV